MNWVFYGICIAFEFVVLLMSLFPSEVRVFLGDQNDKREKKGVC